MKKKINYGRKPVIRTLPPLKETCSTFRGFQGDDRRKERIFAMLQAVIRSSRRGTAQPFYAMRDIASFFGVSVCTVSTVYRRLQNEGLLTLVRGSQTVIPARIPRPRIAVRGVVAMPIWLRGFLHLRDWRNLFSELEEELSRHRFVLQPVFFQQSEEIDPAFVDRVLKFNPDYMVWPAPAQGDRMTMESIIDAGVPILSILGIKPLALPGRIYHTSHERALSRGLEEWKNSGQIDEIVIPYQDGGKVEVTENFKVALQTSPLPSRFEPYDFNRPIPEYLARLAPSPRTGIFFGDQMFFIRLCAMAAEEMFQLFRQHRVIFTCPVMMQSWAMPADIFVDWLSFPIKRLARRLAEDLSQSKSALPSTEEVIEAEWRPHIPLAELARFWHNE